MAFGKFSDTAGRSSLATMSDINVTPMVDVMLVLLIIFIITAPLLNHSIQLDLPKAQAQAAPQQPHTVTLSFDAQGVLYWNAEQVSFAELDSRLSLMGKTMPQAQLQLRADKATQYEVIAQVMAAAQAQGISKIGFITQATTPAPEKK